jgi:hypothetical protein
MSQREEGAPAQGAPKGGLRSDQLSGVLLLLLACYVGWLNRSFPVGSLADPGPGYVPMLLAIALGLFGLLTAVFGIKSQALSAIPWPEGRRAVVILAVAALAAFALERIGYRITVIAMLIFFMGVVERKPPLIVALVSVGFSLASFYVVGDLLNVPLPRGPWEF